MNTKGFTLMEILAVLLILAVVVSFAMPGVRLIREEVQHAQAKTAAIKMADAMRSYYKDTKGYLITGQLWGKRELSTNSSVVDAANQECNNVAATGIPPKSTGGTSNMAQLFACDYLSVKDFASLPYQFNASKDLIGKEILVKAIGTGAAGRHAADAWCVYKDASVAECTEE